MGKEYDNYTECGGFGILIFLMVLALAALFGIGVLFHTSYQDMVARKAAAKVENIQK